MMAPVGLKDRIAKSAARASELARETAESAQESAQKVRDSAAVQKVADSAAVQKVADSAVVQKVADSAPVQAVTGGFAALRTLISDEDEREFVVEKALVTMVRGVRDDDDEPLTDRDVEKAAKRRFKRARRAALLAGPGGRHRQPARRPLLRDRHGLRPRRPARPRPERRADRRADARAVERHAGHRAGRGRDPRDRPVRVGDADPALRRAGRGAMPEKRTKTAVIKAMWNARGLANDARERVMGERNITGVDVRRQAREGVHRARRGRARRRAA